MQEDNVQEVQPFRMGDDEVWDLDMRPVPEEIVTEVEVTMDPKDAGAGVVLIALQPDHPADSGAVVVTPAVDVEPTSTAAAPPVELPAPASPPLPAPAPAPADPPSPKKK